MDNPQKVVFQSPQLYEGMGFALDKPIFMLCTLGVYLLIIFKIGPNYMKNRAAYNLKTFMVFYNISQVLACVYILYSIFNVTALKIFQFWKCDLNIVHTNATEAYNSITMFTFWLKIVELTETVVFVLRKKQKQVSKLHVFHHCSTITLVFSMSKYYKGLSALYPLVLNSFVHIMMYSYYLAAAVCDKKVIEKLTPLKKSITIIQMIQFVLILVQACIMYYTCDIPRVLAIYYGGVILVIFYGFYDFYQKAYIAAQNRKNRIS